jgi:hypothetical protein
VELQAHFQVLHDGKVYLTWEEIEDYGSIVTIWDLKLFILSTK